METETNTQEVKSETQEMKPKKKQSGGCCIFILIIIGIILVFVFLPRKTSKNNDNGKNVVFDFTDHNVYGKTIDPQGLKLLAGDLISIIQTEGSVVVKAKIESSLTKNMTINQNFYTAGDLIRNHGFNTCDEFQYWAVADMTNGQESKVIQYTLTKDVINGIYKGNILDNQIRDYATDVWILPSLLK